MMLRSQKNKWRNFYGSGSWSRSGSGSRSV